MRVTKAGILFYNQEMWLEEPREERERRVCEPLKDIPAQSLQDAEREDYREYCEESWQRFKGRTIMSGEMPVEKLHEAVCCRVVTRT